MPFAFFFSPPYICWQATCSPIGPAGKCILEWDGPHGSKSPTPLLKDMFSSERRKAKILNFSIAYGKTAHGLAKDWKVDLKEAQDTVNKWYSDRPEVRIETTSSLIC